METLSTPSPPQANAREDDHTRNIEFPKDLMLIRLLGRIDEPGVVPRRDHDGNHGGLLRGGEGGSPFRGRHLLEPSGGVLPLRPLDILLVGGWRGLFLRRRRRRRFEALARAAQAEARRQAQEGASGQHPNFWPQC